MCGRCYISHIGEVLLSISSAYHIHLLCKMHFESCAVSHDYQSKRYENRSILINSGSSSLRLYFFIADKTAQITWPMLFRWTRQRAIWAAVYYKMIEENSGPAKSVPLSEVLLYVPTEDASFIDKCTVRNYMIG